jgi:hypothetical protein
MFILDSAGVLAIALITAFSALVWSIRHMPGAASVSTPSGIISDTVTCCAWTAGVAVAWPSLNLGRSSSSASAGDATGGWTRSRSGCDARDAVPAMCAAGRCLDWGSEGQQGELVADASPQFQEQSAPSWPFRESGRRMNGALVIRHGRVGSLDGTVKLACLLCCGRPVPQRQPRLRPSFKQFGALDRQQAPTPVWRFLRVTPLSFLG